MSNYLTLDFINLEKILKIKVPSSLFFVCVSIKLSNLTTDKLRKIAKKKGNIEGKQSMSRRQSRIYLLDHHYQNLKNLLADQLAYF